MKPAASDSIAGLKRISRTLVVLALALAPASAFAQRGAAAGHAAGGARAGGVAAPRAPAVRVPPSAAGRPAVSPIITHPVIGRPIGGLVSGIRLPVSPFRAPLTGSVTGSGILSGPRLPRRPPIRPFGPFLGTANSFVLAYNPFLFGVCNPLSGVASCGLLAPYYGLGGGYFPPAYPSAPYPSGVPDYPSPDYPSGPVYNPPDTSATLQYTPLTSPYPSLASLPPEDLSGSANVSARMRNDVLLYLKDGSVFSVASYTVSNGQLSYVTAYGDKNDVAVDQLDLQKTIQANAARGVAFTLTPASPAAGSSPPSPLGPVPAPPGPIIPAKQ